MPPVDPNDVIITGENSFIRLSTDGSSTMSTRTSHWRVLWCPDGAGHALFIESELTGGAPRIYSDNEAVTRWLQNNIETWLYPAFADTSIPVITASFARDGDPNGEVHERIDGGGDSIVMTWKDCIAPFVLTIPPAEPPARPIGVFSTFFPARTAEITVNGTKAAGAPVAEQRGDRDSSSSCLAWSETWVKPRG